MKHEILLAENMYGHYAEKVILNNFSFRVDRGQIVGLCGTNGSGKTTVMNLLTGSSMNGHWQQKVYIEGNKVNLQNTRNAEALGLYCVRNSPSLLEDLSFSEILYYFGSLHKSVTGRFECDRLADKILKQAGLEFINIHEKIGRLPILHQYLLEIVRSIICGGRIIFIDCMHMFYDAENFSLLKSILLPFQKDGVSFVLLMNHLTEDLLLLLDNLTIIRSGMRARTIYPEQYDMSFINNAITPFMPDFSEASSSDFRTPSHKQPLLSFHNLILGDRQLSFSVLPGETVGIYTDSDSVVRKFLSVFKYRHFKSSSFSYYGKRVKKSVIPWRICRHIYIAPSLSDSDILYPNLDASENITLSARHLSGIPFSPVRKDINKIIIQENRELVQKITDNRTGNIHSHIANLKLIQLRMSLQKSRILILQDPFPYLDDESSRQALDIFKEILARNASIIIIGNTKTSVFSICNEVIKI